MKTGLINKGRKFGPLSPEARIKRRIYKEQTKDYYNPITNDFVTCDPVYADPNYIPVWTLPGRGVWHTTGKIRFINKLVPKNPTGWFSNKYKVIDLRDLMYKEVIADELDSHYIKVSLRPAPFNRYSVSKSAQIIPISQKLIDTFGVPKNLTRV